jgi:hypothetical protein
MRPLADKTARLSVSLSQSDYNSLQRVADENGVSIAWLVRRAVERFLESNPQKELFPGVEVLGIIRR